MRTPHFIWATTLLLLVLLLAATACSKHSTDSEQSQLSRTDSTVTAAPSKAALQQLRQRYESEGNELGVVMVLRELGTRQRDNSRYAEALSTHNQGLNLAEALNDTIEIVRALNNIGTDYRRLSKYEQATAYHYRALKLSEMMNLDSYDALMNRNMSCTGLGSVHLEIGNYARADSLFRLALQGDKQLSNYRGQAMCYANLGIILQNQGQLDSAAAYYLQSMHCNVLVHDTVGLAQCYLNLGSIYEEKGNAQVAAHHYEHAQALLQGSADQWHALNPLIALARLQARTGQYEQATALLRQAEAIAQRIGSIKHLAEIHDISYLMHKQQGQWHEALASMERAQAYKDSLVDIAKINELQNISFNIEHAQQEQLTHEAQQRYERERTRRHASMGLFGGIALLLAAGLGVMIYIVHMRTRHARMTQRLAQAREDFFTNITHEFRTPLTVILGLGQNLADNKALPTTERDNAATIVRQGNNMLLLINQLLDIAKVKSAIGEPEWRHGDVAAQTAMVVESYEAFATSRGIRLHYQGMPKLEADFVPDYLNKIIANLVSNALKFTPQGGKVTVSLAEETDDVVITVADTGVGISPESLPHIFEPFYQQENDSQHVGTGVGLALVHQVVTTVGGTIAVQSTQGQGTTFTMHLPKHHEGSKLADEASTNAGTADPGQQLRVLIIEDNPDVARYMGSLLRGSHKVTYAASGEQGLERARQLVPDLIITDLMMPGIDGFEVCRQVRADEVISHVPIIIVTAKESDDDRVRGIEAGADAYLVKPFNAEVLQATVRQLLRQRQELRKKFSQSLVAGGEPAMQGIDDVDRRFLTKTIDAVYSLLSQRNLSINALADVMCLSTRQLQRKIFALTGQSPATYVLSIKMNRAKQLLTTKPGMSLDEVAEQCGFDHYSGFYHAFKKTFGVTPTQFRRQPKD